MANKVTVTIQGGGTPQQHEVNPGTSRISEIVELKGRSVHLSRNGALVRDVNGSTILETGDNIIVVGNKDVGR